MTQTGLQTLLFVGLGNPGPQYQMTRHNMGFLVIEVLARQLGWSLKEDRRFNAKVVKGVFEGCTIHLLLPLTFMNLSGSSVRRYIDYFKIPVSQMIVVTDDIALPFGQLRLRGMGSAGGHNGLKSIEESLGSAHYKRLRMGIGHPGEKMLANYVLETFSLAENQELSVFIDRGVEVLQRLLKESFVHVMNSVNTVPRQKPAVPAKKGDSAGCGVSSGSFCSSSVATATHSLQAESTEAPRSAGFPFLAGTAGQKRSGSEPIDLTKPPVIGRGE